MPAILDRSRALAALLLCGLTAPAVGAQQIDPLVLRFGDAVGVPGGDVAIIVRTYASRPVRRGTIRLAAGGQRLADAPGVLVPIATWHPTGYLLNEAGTFEPFDVAVEPGNPQVADLDFLDNLLFTLNRRDGVVAVLYATLDAGVLPGQRYDLLGDQAASELHDLEDDPVLIALADGRIDVQAPGAAFQLGVGTPPVQPGSGATLEIDTKQMYAIGSGTIELLYDSAILLPGEQPSVTSDPRHGAVELTVDVSTPGTVTIELISNPDPMQAFLNEAVPGELLKVTIPTHAGAGVPGTTSPVTFGPGTALFAPGGAPLPIAFEPGGVEWCVGDPCDGIFHDNLEIGDAGWWSAVAP